MTLRLISLALAGLLLAALSGCNNVPSAATTDLSVAGGDYLTYSSPKATEVSIDQVAVDPTGAVTLTGLKVKAQPDEATVNQTSAVDQAFATAFAQQSSAMTSAFSALAGQLVGNGASSPSLVSAPPSASTGSSSPTVSTSDGAD